MWDKVRELEQKIVTVCVTCPHAKWTLGRYECQVSFAHCHSKRVKRWRKELKEIEGESKHKG